jgi:prepilin-type N-terminal cleavage/methylation domain-containing protein
MKDKVNSGFTLIELLVVVAIIGILATVGIVAYDGFTNLAKENKTKSNHNIFVKFITAQLLKCIAQSNKGYFEVKSESGNPNFQQQPCDLNKTNTSGLMHVFPNHFGNENFRNPFMPKEPQLHGDHSSTFGIPAAGFTHITMSPDSKILYLTTTFKTGVSPLVTSIIDPRRE